MEAAARQRRERLLALRRATTATTSQLDGDNAAVDQSEVDTSTTEMAPSEAFTAQSTSSTIPVNGEGMGKRRQREDSSEENEEMEDGWVHVHIRLLVVE
jgi:hypothetical protein